MGKRINVKYHIFKNIQDDSPAFRHQIAMIMDECGPEFAKKILWKTLRIEAKGGALTADGSRRRTPGGLYFHLAKQHMTPEQRRAINNYKRKLKSIGTVAFENEVLRPKRDARIAAHQEWVVASQVAKAERLAREAAQAQAEAKAAEAAKKTTTRQNGKHKTPQYGKPAILASRLAALPPEPAFDLPDDLPPHLTAQARQLQSAVGVLRARVEELESKPPAKQVGLEMTRRLLAKTEGQIAALLEAYERSRSGEGVP